MKYRLKRVNTRPKGSIQLESSKSESNRALIINKLAGGKTSNIKYLSRAEDTVRMQALLESKFGLLDARDAGTTMRFLTAYCALGKEKKTLSGTDRMKQRPIGPLVGALRELGATIEYLENEGYPPIEIHPFEQQLTDHLTMPGNISSQYISALLMIAPVLPNGLTISLTTEVYSKPYIQMTLDLMAAYGVPSRWTDNQITIPSSPYQPCEYTIEGDWSGASYWYAFMALSEGKGHLNIPRIQNYSSQGDHVIAEIMYALGVSSHFESGKVKLVKRQERVDHLCLNFKDCPDLAQTVMVVAAATGVTLEMKGLESLKIKETDRIEAMKRELSKLDAMLLESAHKWVLKPSPNLPEAVSIDTYDDHRMAMAFAPLCQVMDVTINDPMVVTKSYPGFWDEMKKANVEIESI